MKNDSGNTPSYWCTIGGQRCGPFTVNRLKQMAKDGTLTATDLVWNKDKSVPAGKIAALFPPTQVAPSPSSEALATALAVPVPPVPSSVPDSEFRYWAFISYSSKDAKLATRLHRQLETYRIPGALVGRPGRDGPVPRKLFPIFRDRDELPLSSDLGSEIRKALRGSRYLLVICTPDAARSHWVNEEIRYFKSLGREDRISGIIAKGAPNGSNNPETADQECFPTAIVHRVGRDGQQTSELAEPLAADLRKTGDGWKNAYLKAIAGITGVGFDAFAKREAKRTFRRRVGLGIFALLLMAFGVIYWDYSRLKVSYFAFAGDRWGVPEGITPLSEHQRAGREVSYRFESRGYRVRSVYRVNSFGSAVEDAEYGTSRTDIVYREDGTVERLLLRDRNNRLVLQKTYSKLAEPNESGQRACTINFLSKADYAQPLKGDAASLSIVAGKTSAEASKSNISVHEVLFNKEGRLEIVLFRNSYGSPASDASGVFGQKHEHNELGLSIRTINLDSKGQPMSDRKGVQQIKRERNQTGAILRQSYQDADNRAVLNPELVATLEYTYDDFGNQTEWRCLNINSAPTLHKDGYYRAVFEYDSHGSEVRKALFGLDDKPTLNRDGYASYQAEIDQRGRTTKLTYFGTDGSPTVVKNGYAALSILLDDRGNSIGGDYLGIDGKLAVGADGWAKIRSTIDASGNYIESLLFDATDNPTTAKDGVHRVVNTYDNRNNRIDHRYFGIDGRPTINNEGIFSTGMVYDERGNVTEESYYGVDEAPVLHKNGMARITHRYDDHGNLVERAYFGLKGDPIAHRDGYAKYVQSYDDRGNLIEVAYYDTQGSPTLSRHGYARRRTTYDELGRAIRSDYIGATGQPVLDEKGRARLTRVLDAAGNIVEEAYFDINHRPVANADDVSVAKTQWDSRGNVISIRTFGKTGKPVEHKKFKFFQSDMTYDERGNQTSIAFFGNGGVPLRGGADDVAKRTRKYDTRNNIIEERYFDVDGKPMKNNDSIAVMTAAYDERDNRVEVRYYDMNGSPTISRLGMARVATSYDARSRRVAESYFDVADKLVLDHEGVARLTARYDDHGNITAQAFYGTDGRPIRSSVGFSRSEIAYDIAGNVIEQRYFGADGLPIFGPTGSARYTARYDAATHIVEVAFFGKDNGLCISTTLGFARALFRYDRNGNKISEAFFGSDGKPLRGNGGYARLEMTFDDRGNNTEIAYFDESDLPILNFQGTARTVREFDKYGNITEARCYGVDGSLKNCDFGFARLVDARDAAGRLVERSCFDEKGRLALWKGNKEGYARFTRKYDNQGDIVEEAYFGADNKPIAARDNGIARAEVRYHQSGQMLEIRRFGADGGPLQSEKLPYLEECVYDDNGKMTAYRNLYLSPNVATALSGKRESRKDIIKYDAAGNVISCDAFHFLAPQDRGKGTAVQEHQIYDAASHRIGTRYYDEQGQLAIGPNGNAVEKIVNDANGLAVRVEAFDEKGQRAKSLEFAGMTMNVGRVDIQYDSFGQPIEYLLFDADDKPPVSDTVPYRGTMKYGTRGKSIESTLYFLLPPNAPRTAAGSAPIRKILKYDQDGKPIGMGVHREFSGSKETGDLVCVAQHFDMKSRELEASYYGPMEKPVMGPFGFSKRIQVYDKNGLQIELRYFGTDKPIIPPGASAAAILTRRDADGHDLETRWLGVDSQPRENADGVAIVRKKWDDMGRELEIAYFDHNDKPTRNQKLGVARISTSFDDAKNLREDRYFDVSGNPTPSALGTFRRTVRSDVQRRAVEERFYDAEGRPMRSNQGAAGILKKYGTGPQPIEAVTVDEAGKPCRSIFGYVKALYERDARGNPIREEYLDEADKPAPPTTSEGFNCAITVFDPANRPRSKTWTITGGKTLPGSGNVAKLSTRLDERGNALESRYLNAADQPTMNANGVAIGRFDYDSQGRPVRDRYFDADMKPALFKGLYHQMTQRYEGDRTAEIAYLDKEDGLVIGPTGFARLVRTSVAGGAPTWKAYNAEGGAAQIEVFIETVMPGGQADKAGLKSRDVIVSYNDVRIIHNLQLLEAIDSDGPMERRLVIDRGGRRIEVSVQRGRLGIVLKTRGI